MSTLSCPCFFYELLCAMVNTVQISCHYTANFLNKESKFSLPLVINIKRFSVNNCRVFKMKSIVCSVR